MHNENNGQKSLLFSFEKARETRDGIKVTSRSVHIFYLLIMTTLMVLHLYRPSYAHRERARTRAPLRCPVVVRRQNTTRLWLAGAKKRNDNRIIRHKCQASKRRRRWLRRLWRWRLQMATERLRDHGTGHGLRYGRGRLGGARARPYLNPSPPSPRGWLTGCVCVCVCRRFTAKDVQLPPSSIHYLGGRYDRWSTTRFHSVWAATTVVCLSAAAWEWIWRHLSSWSDSASERGLLMNVIISRSSSSSGFF